MHATLNSIRSKLSKEQYVQELFDPVQTHAVYNVPKDDVELIKEMLSAHKANRFRVVKPKTNTGACIVCFKLK